LRVLGEISPAVFSISISEMKISIFPHK